MTASRDREYAIWVTPDELGMKKEISIDGKSVAFTVPPRIDGHIILRLRGLGYVQDGEAGDLLVQINLMNGGSGASPMGGQGDMFRRSPSSSGTYPPGGEGSESPGFRYRVFGGGMYGDAPPVPEPPIEDPNRFRRGGLMIALGGLLISAASYAGLFPIAPYWGALVAIPGLLLALHKK